MGETTTEGGKGQVARKGYDKKRGLEGGQQPLQRRLPKVGFTSKIAGSCVINVEEITTVKELNEIAIESVKSVHRISKSATKIKLVGASAKDLTSEIKDENVSVIGSE